MKKDPMSFSLDLFTLKGKVAMITGANQGLGLTYAIALAKAGADIFIPHFTSDVTEVKEAVESLGRKIAFLQGDLTDADYRQRCVDACLAEFGRIDILINNAGCNFTAPLLDFPDSKWKMVVDLQLEAVHYLSHLVAPVMVRQGGGKIINIASALSFAADMNSTAYTVAKHGIVGMTRSYAAELGKYNITCNAIAPGFFATEMNDAVRAANPSLYNKVCDRISLCQDGQWGDTCDLMGAVVFLSSPASNYINGDVLVVDGGFQALMA
ncbi:MAG: SDR family oxidoreductase [Oscillospiraceae bacterium]